jgi:hypothetical protein
MPCRSWTGACCQPSEGSAVCTRPVDGGSGQLASRASASAVGMSGAALTVGVTPVEAKEVVYQAMPYVGMGRVFEDASHARGARCRTAGRRVRARLCERLGSLRGLIVAALPAGTTASWYGLPPTYQPEELGGGLPAGAPGAVRPCVSSR